MQIRYLEHGDKPSRGFIRRPRPVWVEFALRMTWFSEMELQYDGQEEGMAYCWVKGVENHRYEKPVKRTRYCKTYKGKPRILAEQQRGCS